MKIFELHQVCIYVKTKAQISFAVTVKLISVSVFATPNVQFLYFLNLKSNDMALMTSICRMLPPGLSKVVTKTCPHSTGLCKMLKTKLAHCLQMNSLSFNVYGNLFFLYTK